MEEAERPGRERQQVDVEEVDFSMLSASAAPARNTKAGAQTCVTQRVKNCAVGSGVPGR